MVSQCLSVGLVVELVVVASVLFETSSNGMTQLVVHLSLVEKIQV